ncbi:hypothetical protein L6452_42262 [Arctium lappa]|uniref:Uncharacterized protein n=1 Tax=Arctium lappa TaxID=4217 RepID=A0ACB8XH66_ARCLA|nr:hypothetical protein L6452_42262 [Arctium lappa]
MAIMHIRSKFMLPLPVPSSNSVLNFIFFVPCFTPFQKSNAQTTLPDQSEVGLECDREAVSKRISSWGVVISEVQSNTENMLLVDIDKLLCMVMVHGRGSNGCLRQRPSGHNSC